MLLKKEFHFSVRGVVVQQQTTSTQTLVPEWDDMNNRPMSEHNELAEVPPHVQRSDWDVTFARGPAKSQKALLTKAL